MIECHANISCVFRGNVGRIVVTKEGTIFLASVMKKGKRVEAKGMFQRPPPASITLPRGHFYALA